MTLIDMRKFAEGAGINVSFKAGSTVFKQGDPGNTMYVVQSGVVEMIVGEKIVEVCGPNEAIGFVSLLDRSPRTATAMVREDVELSVLDEKKFRFMVDEIPNFAMYIIESMAMRIRGMSETLS